jgi:hypothetical protein
MGPRTEHLKGLPHWLFVQYVAFRVRVITILYALHILDRLKHKSIRMSSGGEWRLLPGTSTKGSCKHPAAQMIRTDLV